VRCAVSCVRIIATIEAATRRATEDLIEEAEGYMDFIADRTTEEALADGMT
jgi:hypothetical protein